MADAVDADSMVTNDNGGAADGENQVQSTLSRAQKVYWNEKLA